MQPTQATEKMTLHELDQTLVELIELGLIQGWPSRESRYRVVGEESYS